MRSLANDDLMMAQGAVATDAERAALALRADIVRGVLAPSAKLKMRELTARYGLGASPLREALSRLAAEGYVTLESQKGYRVPPLSAEHLDDITRSRQHIECEAFRLAIEHGDARWEAGIVAQFHLFEQAVQRVAKSRRRLDEGYEAAHFAFHRSLLAACPLPSLLAFSELLYRQGARYRHLMMRALEPNAHLIAAHGRLKSLALARKTPAAVAALRQHIAIPAAQLARQLNAAAKPRRAA
jgi:DNA-binding GntR family transcriptional regulator